jgi:RimJ/RimL family protein N-acetyltransferase
LVELLVWVKVQQIHHVYHHPDYFCPEPYDQYPSHVHIDLLPRAQGRGLGRAMMAAVLALLRQRGSPGAHLGVSLPNVSAQGFYRKLGFQPLIQVGEGMDGCLYLGQREQEIGGDEARSRNREYVIRRILWILRAGVPAAG